MSPAISPTEASTTKLLGLGYDRFFAPPAVGGVGTPVLIDRDGDAQITLADGATIIELNLYTEANATLGIKLAPNKVEISTTELKEGSEIRIDGVTIGEVAYYGGHSITVELVAATTLTEIEALRVAVEKLIRALTYTNHDTVEPTPEKIVVAQILDSNGDGDDALVFAADRILGTDADNTIEIESSNISWGDELDGGAGADVLQLLGGGSADLSFLSKFEGIETVQGSDADDTIFAHAGQIRKLTKIDGGGQTEDRLHISGDTVNLQGIAIERFGSVTYEGVGTTVIVDNLSVARLLDGDFADGETLTIAGGDLSDSDRLELHKQGIDSIMHNGRKTTLADLEGTPTTPTTPTTPSADAPMFLVGTKGRNVLTGAGGADTLNGGYGNDVLTGGLGADVFVFNAKLGTSKTDRKVNFDTITDFSVADDTIHLDNKIFKKLKNGALNKKFFSLNKAKQKDDYIVYKNGVVSYDADGSGKKYKAVEIIKIANKAKLTADDFFVI